MAWYKCMGGNGGGGGGNGLPTFTDTTIATGTSAGTLTFTGDYHGYDFVVLRCTNESTSDITDLLTTPDMLDAIFNANNNEMVVNEFSNNQYGNYRKDSSSTWTRTASRNLYISKVTGLVCNNYTVVETEVYNRGSYGTSDVTITGTGFLDYDLLVIASSVDGIQPNSLSILKPVGTDDFYPLFVTPYNRYNKVTVSDTEISSAPYHYVGGIKFT